MVFSFLSVLFFPFLFPSFVLYGGSIAVFSLFVVTLGVWSLGRAVELARAILELVELGGEGLDPVPDGVSDGDGGSALGFGAHVDE